MRLKERVDDLDFRLYALETAVRVLASAVDLTEQFDEGLEDQLREELREAQTEASDGDVPAAEMNALVDDIMAAVLEILGVHAEERD